jgi:predicted nicotinamide N-methyase
MIEDRRGFILANTRLQAPPLIPEIRLHLADEITPIWSMTEAALERTGLPPPFWAFAWAGGQALARWLLDHPEAVAGRTVLDFAAGGGLVAIAAMRAGAASALACDIDPFCEAAVALNAETNGVGVAFTSGDLLSRPPPAVDLVLAGDIAYEKPVAAWVRAWLGEAAARGAAVLVGDPRRTYFDPAGLRLLGEYDVPTTRELEDREVKRAGVWTFPP